MEMLQGLGRVGTALGKPKGMTSSGVTEFVSGGMPVGEQKWCVISLKLVCLKNCSLVPESCAFSREWLPVALDRCWF